MTLLVVVITVLSIMFEDLTCLYHFDSDKYDFDFFIYVLYAFCVCNTIISAIAKPIVGHLCMIIIEVAQAYVMILFVGGFDAKVVFFWITFNSAVFFGIILFIQIVCEVLGMRDDLLESNVNQTESNNNNNNSSSNQPCCDTNDDAFLMSVGLVFLIGFYSIPTLYFKTAVADQIGQQWLDVLFTIGIAMCELIIVVWFKDLGWGIVDDYEMFVNGIVILPIVLWALSVFVIELSHYNDSNDYEKAWIILHCLPIFACCMWSLCQMG